MRVLFVIHDFLPGHPSGSEIHTAELAVRLRERGHDVRVFTTEKDIRRPHLSLERRSWNGIVVHELVNNLFYLDFRQTWDFPPAVDALRRVLDEFRPDVVHFMHLLYLSVGCVEAAAERGVPVFFTLHDYWLQCARFGQLVHADGSICHRVDFARCGSCLTRLKYAQTPLERRVARGVASVHSRLGVDLTPLVRLLQRFLPAPTAAPAEGEREARELEMERAMAERDRELKRRVVPHVQCFFAPSRFMRERFLAWGIPAQRIVHVPYGIETGRLGNPRRAKRRPSTPVRVAFLGTLAPHKAPHLLLDAWSRLVPELRERATLTIYGPKLHHPEYVASLAARAEELSVSMPGAIEPHDVARVWEEIDLIVIPSTWYENSPLTLLEARATCTPALVSDLGGMAELMEEGRYGWTFRNGDVTDLVRQLSRLLSDPGELGRLDFGSEPVRGVDRTAEEFERRYGIAMTSSPDTQP